MTGSLLLIGDNLGLLRSLLVHHVLLRSAWVHLMVNLLLLRCILLLLLSQHGRSAADLAYVQTIIVDLWRFLIESLLELRLGRLSLR